MRQAGTCAIGHGSARTIPLDKEPSMRGLILAAAVAALTCSAPALAQTRLGPNQAPAPTPTTAAEYVMQAALSDRYEIESSRLAVARAKSPELKAFAQQMIDAHTATTAALMAALPEAGLAAPDTSRPDKMRQAMLDALQQSAGASTEFDDRYRGQQLQAHKEALALHQNYAKNGDNAVLREVAADTAPKVEHHLHMLDDLQP
jgi:putative membrane protein